MIGRFAAPLQSAAAEQVAATEMFISLLVASRRLFMSVINQPGMEDNEARAHDRAGGRALREVVMKHSQDIVLSCIQMGATELLHKSDICEWSTSGASFWADCLTNSVFVYRVLAAARLLLACSLLAKADEDEKQVNQCRSSVQAASMLLHRFVTIMPIALGAAETLDETCRGERIASVQ